MKIFRLEEIAYRMPKKQDGGYSIRVRFAGVYGSGRSAEAMIRAIVAKNEEEHRVGFWLFENTVDGGFVGPFKEICEYDSVRTYLADGSKLCECLCDEACELEFKGRDPKTLKLRPGDVAFWVGTDYAEPILIEKTPPDKAYWRLVKANIKKRLGKGATSGWDYTDDAYLAYLCSICHDHPLTWQVFPAWGTVSKRTRMRLQRTKKWHDDMNAAYVAEREKRRQDLKQLPVDGTGILISARSWPETWQKTPDNGGKV